jgi:hypothetical protein
LTEHSISKAREIFETFLFVISLCTKVMCATLGRTVNSARFDRSRRFLL